MTLKKTKTARPSSQESIRAPVFAKPWREPVSWSSSTAAERQRRAATAIAAQLQAISAGSGGDRTKPRRPRSKPIRLATSTNESRRRMLTEGSRDQVSRWREGAPQTAPWDYSSRPAVKVIHCAQSAGAAAIYAPPKRVQSRRRNPFRGAQELGKHSLEAAVDMFKSLGGGPGDRTPEVASRRGPRKRRKTGDQGCGATSSTIMRTPILRSRPSCVRKKQVKYFGYRACLVTY